MVGCSLCFLQHPHTTPNCRPMPSCLLSACSCSVANSPCALCSDPMQRSCGGWLLLLNAPHILFYFAHTDFFILIPAATGIAAAHSSSPGHAAGFPIQKIWFGTIGGVVGRYRDIRTAAACTSQNLSYLFSMTKMFFLLQTIFPVHSFSPGRTALTRSLLGCFGSPHEFSEKLLSLYRGWRYCDFELITHVGSTILKRVKSAMFCLAKSSRRFCSG